MTERQRAIDILKFWRAVEIFDIPSIKKEEKNKYQHIYNSRKRNIGTALPWNGNKLKGIYYQVYLCVPSRENLVKRILSLIPEAPKMDTGEYEKFKENACLAVFCVDSAGKPIATTYTLASFIIGVQKLSIPEDLERINEYLYKYSKSFDSRVSENFPIKDKEETEDPEQPEDENDEKQVDWQYIFEEFDLILKITDLLTTNKDIEVVIKQFKLKDDSDLKSNSELLNSFFLDELDTLVKIANKPFGKAFTTYLSQGIESERNDLSRVF